MADVGGGETSFIRRHIIIQMYYLTSCFEVPNREGCRKDRVGVQSHNLSATTGLTRPPTANHSMHGCFKVLQKPDLQ